MWWDPQTNVIYQQFTIEHSANKSIVYKEPLNYHNINMHIMLGPEIILKWRSDKDLELIYIIFSNRGQTQTQNKYISYSQMEVTQRPRINYRLYSQM